MNKFKLNKIMKTTSKSGWENFCTNFQLLMYFNIMVEGVKWFHNKFGIIGDVILILFFTYIILGAKYEF